MPFEQAVLAQTPSSPSTSGSNSGTASGSSSGTGYTTTCQGCPTSMHLFNSSSLPQDVLTRYNKSRSRCVLTGTELHTLFSTGFQYFKDGLKRLILADGSLFTICLDQDWKALHKSALTCRSDTHTGIHE